MPDNLYKLKKLQYLVGDGNSFTGTIKPGIGELSYLLLLSFRSNELSGVIPEDLYKLPLIGMFDIYCLYSCSLENRAFVSQYLI